MGINLLSLVRLSCHGRLSRTRQHLASHERLSAHQLSRSEYNL